MRRRRRWLLMTVGALVLGCTGAAEFVEARNPAPPDAPSAAASSSVSPVPSSAPPPNDAGP